MYYRILAKSNGEVVVTTSQVKSTQSSHNEDGYDNCGYKARSASVTEQSLTLAWVFIKMATFMLTITIQQSIELKRKAGCTFSLFFLDLR